MQEINWDQYEKISDNSEPEETIDWSQYEKVKTKPDLTIPQKASRYGRDVLAGLANLGQQVGRAPYELTRKFSPRVAEKIPHAKKLNFSEVFGIENPTTSDIVIQSLSEMAPSLALPQAALGRVGKYIGKIPKVGQYLSAGLSEALPQAGFAATEQLGEEGDPAKAAAIAGGTAAPFGAVSKLIQQGSPILRSLGRGAQAVGAGYGAHEVGKSLDLPAAVSFPATLLAGYLGHKGFRPKVASRREVLSDISPESVKDIMEASRRLGLEYLTPAEATGSPFIGEREGGFGKTPGGARLRYERGTERLKSEERSINALFDELYDDSTLSPQMKAAYQKSMQASVPKDFIEANTSKPVIETAMNKLERDPAYKQALGGVPKDSFMYWDQVKKILEDMENSALKGKDPKRYKASIIGDTRRQMVEKMDEIEPVYEQARGLAKRKKVREQLEKAFEKKSITGRNFYKAVENSREFSKMMNSLKDFPEAQQKLTDMRSVFSRLIDVPTARTTAALERTSMSKSRSTAQNVAELAKRLFGTKRDKAAIELMTDPKWDELLATLNNRPKAEALSQLTKIIGRTTAQSLSK